LQLLRHTTIFILRSFASQATNSISGVRDFLIAQSGEITKHGMDN
jgi:hypothetical protein